MTTRPRHDSILFFLLASCLWLAACDPPIPQIGPLPTGATLLAFGDSITHGNGAGPGESYPDVLAALSGFEVINAGVPGEVTAGGRERLAGLLDRYRPALLLLCHGGNDLLRKTGMDMMRRNLEAMIDMAHARDIPVMLIGVPQPGLFMLESAEVYGEVAASYGLPFDGETLPDIYSDKRLKSDQIHPNAAGYRQLAEGVFELMRESGVLVK